MKLEKMSEYLNVTECYSNHETLEHNLNVLYTYFRSISSSPNSSRYTDPQTLAFSPRITKTLDDINIRKTAVP